MTEKTLVPLQRASTPNDSPSIVQPPTMQAPTTPARQCPLTPSKKCGINQRVVGKQTEHRGATRYANVWGEKTHKRTEPNVNTFSSTHARTHPLRLHQPGVQPQFRYQLRYQGCAKTKIQSHVS